MATLAEILQQSPAETNLKQFSSVDNAGNQVFTKGGALTAAAQAEVVTSLAAKADGNPASSVFENLHKKAVEACKIGEPEISFTKDSLTAKSKVVADEDSDGNDTLYTVITHKDTPDKPIATVFLNKQGGQSLLVFGTTNKEYPGKLAEVAATEAGKPRVEILNECIIDVASDPQGLQLLQKMEESGNLKASLDIPPPEKGEDTTAPGKPGKVEETAAPGKPGKVEETAAPGKPGKVEDTAAPGKPGKVEETAAPGKPGKVEETAAPGKPGKVEETAAPGKPGKVEETAAPGKPGKVEETAAPGKPGKVEDTAAPSRPDSEVSYKEKLEKLTKKYETENKLNPKAAKAAAEADLEGEKESPQPEPPKPPKISVEIKKPLHLEDDNDTVQWLNKALSDKSSDASGDLAITLLTPETTLKGAQENCKWLSDRGRLKLFENVDGPEATKQLLKDLDSVKANLQKAPEATKTLVQCFGPEELLKDYNDQGTLTESETLTVKVLQMGTDQLGKFTPAQVQESLELTKKLVSELHSEEGVLQQAMTLQYKAPQQVTLSNLLQDLGTKHHTPDALAIKNLISQPPKDSSTLRAKSGTKSLLEANKEESWMEVKFPQDSYVHINVKFIHLVMEPAKAITEGQATVHTTKLSSEQAGALQSLLGALKQQAGQSELKDTKCVSSMKVAAAVDMKPGKNIFFTEDTTKAPDVALHLKVENPKATSVMMKGKTQTDLDPQDPGKTQENAFHALMAKTQEGETTAIIQGGAKSPVPVDLMDYGYNPIPHATSNTASEVFAVGTVATA